MMMKSRVPAKCTWHFIPQGLQTHEAMQAMDGPARAQQVEQNKNEQSSTTHMQLFELHP